MKCLQALEYHLISVINIDVGEDELRKKFDQQAGLP